MCFEDETFVSGGGCDGPNPRVACPVDHGEKTPIIGVLGPQRVKGTHWTDSVWFLVHLHLRPPLLNFGSDSKLNGGRFGFSAEKCWKTAFCLYFSESGCPKTGPVSFWCILVHGGAVDRRGCHVATSDWPTHTARSTKQRGGGRGAAQESWTGGGPRGSTGLAGPRALGPREHAVERWTGAGHVAAPGWRDHVHTVYASRGAGGGRCGGQVACNAPLPRGSPILELL